MSPCVCNPFCHKNSRFTSSILISHPVGDICFITPFCILFYLALEGSVDNNIKRLNK